MCEDARLDALVRDEEAVERQRVLDEEMARALFGEEAGGATEGAGAGKGETVFAGGDLMGSRGGVGADPDADGDGAIDCCVGYGGHADMPGQDQDAKSNTSASGGGGGKREKWTEVYSHASKAGSGVLGEVSLLD